MARRQQEAGHGFGPARAAEHTSTPSRSSRCSTGPSPAGRASRAAATSPSSARENLSGLRRWKRPINALLSAVDSALEKIIGGRPSCSTTARSERRRGGRPGRGHVKVAPPPLSPTRRRPSPGTGYRPTWSRRTCAPTWQRSTAAPRHPAMRRRAVKGRRPGRGRMTTVPRRLPPRRRHRGGGERRRATLRRRRGARSASTSAWDGQLVGGAALDATGRPLPADLRQARARPCRPARGSGRARVEDPGGRGALGGALLDRAPRWSCLPTCARSASRGARRAPRPYVRRCAPGRTC